MPAQKAGGLFTPGTSLLEMKDYMIEINHSQTFANVCLAYMSQFSFKLYILNKKKKMRSFTGALALESATEEREHKYTCYYFLMCRKRNSIMSVITFGRLQTV